MFTCLICEDLWSTYCVSSPVIWGCSSSLSGYKVLCFNIRFFWGHLHQAVDSALVLASSLPKLGILESCGVQPLSWRYLLAQKLKRKT